MAEGDEERGQPTKLGSLPPAPPLPSFVALRGCVRAYTVPGKGATTISGASLARQTPVLWTLLPLN